MFTLLMLLFLAQTAGAPTPEVTEAEAQRVVDPFVLWEYDTGA